jgi:hypothetical protein
MSNEAAIRHVGKLTFLRTCFLTLPAMAGLGWVLRALKWELIVRGIPVNSDDRRRPCLADR